MAEFREILKWQNLETNSKMSNTKTAEFRDKCLNGGQDSSRKGTGQPTPDLTEFDPRGRL